MKFTLQERTLAGEQGDAWTQFILGEMYYQGYKVAQDYDTALKWYTRAAEQILGSIDIGTAYAQTKLGRMHYHGLGVPKDCVRAYMWFDLAASFGDHKASKERDFIAKEMTQAEIEDAQKLAWDWIDERQR